MVRGLHQTLLLTAPYGHGNGDHVSLRHEGILVPEAVRECLLAFSCYPPAIPKILDCLELSGRYDCVLQPGWFRHQYSHLRARLAELGVELIVFELCSHHKGRLR